MDKEFKTKVVAWMSLLIAVLTAASEFLSHS